MQWHAGREHVRGGECFSVRIPTPLMPKAMVAVLIARSALLGVRLSSRAPLRGEDEACRLCLRTSYNQGCETATSPFEPARWTLRAGLRELGPPRFFRRPRVAGTIGRRSACRTPY